MVMNYLRPDAVANGSPARMARYWPATANSPGSIGIVAVLLPGGEWKAYIASCYPEADYEHVAEHVATWGSKLSREDAIHFFPDLEPSLYAER